VNGRAFVKEIETGRIIHAWEPQDLDSLAGEIGFTSDNRFFIYPRNDKIELWSLKSGRLEQVLSQAELYRFAEDADRNELLVSDRKGHISSWNLENYQKVWATSFKEDFPAEFATALAISRDGKYLAAGSYGLFKLYDRTSGTEIGRYCTAPHTRGVAKCIRSMCFSYDSKRLAIGFDDVLLIWNIAPAICLKRIDENLPTWLIQFSPSGKRILTINAGLDTVIKDRVKTYTLKILDVSTGKLLTHKEVINVAEVTQDGRILSWGAENDRVLTYLWNENRIEQFTGGTVDKDMGELVGEIIGYINGRRWNRVAVMASAAGLWDESEFEKSLCEELATRLSHKKEFTVVEKHLLSTALQELRLTCDYFAAMCIIGKVSSAEMPSAAGQIEKLTGADGILIINARDMGTRVRVSCFGVDAEKGTVEALVREGTKDYNMGRSITQ